MNINLTLNYSFDKILWYISVKKGKLMLKKLSKSIQDASFHEIIRQLQYKTKNKGKYFYQIDTFYPSAVCNSEQTGL